MFTTVNTAADSASDPIQLYSESFKSWLFETSFSGYF
jgi:hypothetical protein